MRRYVPKLRLYFKGSEAMQATMAELQQLLSRRPDGQAAGDGAVEQQAASSDAVGQPGERERRQHTAQPPQTAPTP